VKYLRANVSCVNLYTFSNSPNCVLNKFSVLKHSLKLNKNSNIHDIKLILYSIWGEKEFIKLIINLILLFLFNLRLYFKTEIDSVRSLVNLKMNLKMKHNKREKRYKI